MKNSLLALVAVGLLVFSVTGVAEAVQKIYAFEGAVTSFQNQTNSL